MKHIYRALVLLLVFAGALVFFGFQMKIQNDTGSSAVTMEAASLPLLTLKTGDTRINLLHGYTGSMDEAMFRDSITPVGSTQTFTVLVSDESDTSLIRKLSYEVTAADTGSGVEQGDILALKTDSDGNKYADIQVTAALSPNTEYLLKLTASTVKNKRIYYYTRLVREDEDSHLAAKIAWILDFQKMTMDSGRREELADYLETSADAPKDNYAEVTIASDPDLVGYGDLMPQTISTIVPTVKENNTDSTSVRLSYYIEADPGSGRKTYQITEFYRVRWTEKRIYLLDYHRTMKQEFDLSAFDVDGQAFSLGIIDPDDVRVMTNSAGDRIGFVDRDSLWCWNAGSNECTEVFTFAEKDDYDRGGFDSHHIELLYMDDAGNMDFMVCGYMNRGAYEGKVAVVLYHYSADDAVITEKACIPVEIPYELLRQSLHDFAYINSHSVFFFSMDTKIYRYDMITQKMTVLAEDADAESFLSSGTEQYLIWQNASDRSASTKLTLMNLETEETKEIAASDGELVGVLARSTGGILIGYAKSADVGTDTDGNQIVPYYRVDVLNASGEVQMTYSKDGLYVTDVNAQDKVAVLSEVKKSGKHYAHAADDYILNHTAAAVDAVSLSSAVSRTALTEYSIALSKKVSAKTAPAAAEAGLAGEGSALTLNVNIAGMEEGQYYVYAYGELYSSYNSLRKAIPAADAASGTVADSSNRVVWSRSRAESHGIHSFSAVYGGNGVDSFDACVQMMAAAAGVKADKDAAASGTMMERMRAVFGDKAVNLTGCTLDEVLYYISIGHPVAAVTSAGNAVLISGYDTQYIKYVDPAGRSWPVILTAAGKTKFEAGGNRFYTYME